MNDNTKIISPPCPKHGQVEQQLLFETPIKITKHQPIKNENIKDDKQTSFEIDFIETFKQYEYF